jgi:hypothetical protein
VSRGWGLGIRPILDAPFPILDNAAGSTAGGVFTKDTEQSAGERLVRGSRR